MDRDAFDRDIAQVFRKHGLGGAAVLYRDGIALVTTVIAKDHVEYAALRLIAEVCVAATASSKGAVNKAMADAICKNTSVN